MVKLIIQVHGGAGGKLCVLQAKDDRYHDEQRWIDHVDELYSHHRILGNLGQQLLEATEGVRPTEASNADGVPPSPRPQQTLVLKL